MILLAAVLFSGGGCGGTPEPAPALDPIDSRQLFYSSYLEPDEDYEDEPSAGEAGEVSADEEESAAIEAGEFIAGREEPSAAGNGGLSRDQEDSPDDKDYGLTPGEEDPSDPANDPAGDSYLINPHDLLDISVLGESDLSLSVRVSERGTVSFPLLGEIRAAGYSPIQFERRLEALLGKDYLVSPSVNVTIKEYGTIAVLGQVQKPGSFEIKGRLTVTRAIAQAGGLTSTASPNRTRIIRKYKGREEIIPVRLNDILKDGDLSQDIPLLPGDLIVVPESFF